MGDVLSWHAFARVDKYSDDQVVWARKRLAGLEPEGRHLHAFFAAR